MMETKKSSRSVYRLLILLKTAVLISAIEPATEIICRKYTGPVPAAPGFTWSIPLSPKGKSATFQVQVQRDFHLLLVPDLSLSPPAPWDSKYLAEFGVNYNGQCTMGNNAATYNRGLMNANSPVALWLSWYSGSMAAGTGSVVGENQIMSFIDSSPSRVNYMLIGGWYVAGTVEINYCFASFYDQRFPVDQPTSATVMTTVSDCGRTCEEDPQCMGYALARNAPLVGHIACNMFYWISGLQYNPQYVTYVYSNGTYPAAI